MYGSMVIEHSALCMLTEIVLLGIMMDFPVMVDRYVLLKANFAGINFTTIYQLSMKYRYITK